MRLFGPILLLVAALFVEAAGTQAIAEDTVLPNRPGPRPETTQGVPHVQIGVTPAPEIKAELLRRVARIPGLEVRPTIISLPGAEGFWILEDVPLARPDVIVGGREFAHVHPDGSLHASLEQQRAEDAVSAGWAVLHPWAAHRKGWEGFVMLYTPASQAELDVVFQLVVDGYNFVTGQEIRASEIERD